MNGKRTLTTNWNGTTIGGTVTRQRQPHQLGQRNLLDALSGLRIAEQLRDTIENLQEVGNVRLLFVGALSFFAVAMAAPIAGAADLPAATYVHAGKLLDVRSGKMLSDQLIVIRGDRIERVVASRGVQIPAGAATVDLTHATVLPGLIDCHTHIMLTDTDDSHYDDILLKQSWQYRTILATLNVKRDLEAGFTAMRDVETEGAMYSDVDVRNAINQGLIPGPRLKVATRGISTTGGYGLEGYSPEVTVPVGVADHRQSRQKRARPFANSSITALT